MGSAAGALERLARHERADHRDQHRLRRKGAARLLQTQPDRARPDRWDLWSAASLRSRSWRFCRPPCSSSAVGAATKWLLLLVQWPLLIVLVMLGLAVLYRFGPDRDKPQWRWVSPGAIAATSCGSSRSIGFTVYVANFNSYDKTYGSLGGVVILLTWLYLSALMVLLGAVDQRAVGAADPQGFHRRSAAGDGTAGCACRRHAR